MDFNSMFPISPTAAVMPTLADYLQQQQQYQDSLAMGPPSNLAGPTVPAVTPSPSMQMGIPNASAAPSIPIPSGNPSTQLSSLISNLQQPQPGEAQLNTFAQSLMNGTAAPANGGKSYQQEVQDFLDKQKADAANTEKTKGQWHGFIDNIKHNPAFAQSLAALGAALSRPGNFSENLGLGAVAATQIMEKAKEKQKEEAKQKREEEMQNFQLLMKGKELDQQAQNTILSQKVAGSNLMESLIKAKSTQGFELAQLFSGMEYKKAELGIRGAELGLEGQRTKAQVDEANAHLQLYQQEMKAKEQELKDSGIGLLKISPGDNPVNTAFNTAFNIYMRGNVQPGMNQAQIAALQKQGLNAAATDSTVLQLTGLIHPPKEAGAISQNEWASQAINLVSKAMGEDFQNMNLPYNVRVQKLLAAVPEAKDGLAKLFPVQGVPGSGAQNLPGSTPNPNMTPTPVAASPQDLAKAQSVVSAKIPGATVTGISSRGIEVKSADGKTGFLPLSAMQ